LFKDKPIHKILLSIDSDVFSYVPKCEAKKKFGISIEKKVIFFGSTSVDHKRKGMNYLIEALKILDETRHDKFSNILLLVAGNFDDTQSLLPFESRNLGILENNEELASVYQAADVFVCPSIEDSGPMMINQAIMTGTPVVSFEMGVSEDLVITGQTGYRAELKNSRDMAAGINFVLSLSEIEHQAMCVNSRNLALSNCSYKVSTERILKLIQNESVNG
jgi:glycosyltransferase involved in cell wall biosynthesis